MKGKKFSGILILAIFFSILSLTSAGAALKGTTLWTAKTDTPVTSDIAVSGGLILAGDASGNFYAVDKNSGRIAWRCRGKNTIVGTPAVADGKVIFVQADGSITCLKLSDGSPVWNFEADIEGIGLTILDGAAVGDGKVFVARGDGGLYAMNLSNGHTVWTYQSSGPELRTAPAFGEGYVMLGEQNGKFSMIDPKTGKRVSGGGAGGAVNTPVIDNGSVYFSSWDGSVQRVQVKGIIPKWNSKVNDPVTTKPVIGGGRVFVGTANGLIAALSAEGGNIIWKFATNGGSVESVPVFTGDTVIAIDGQGVLYILDAATGRQRANFDIATANANSAFDGGVLFIAGRNSEIIAMQ